MSLRLQINKALSIDRSSFLYCEVSRPNSSEQRLSNQLESFSTHNYVVPPVSFVFHTSSTGPAFQCNVKILLHVAFDHEFSMTQSL